MTYKNIKFERAEITNIKSLMYGDQIMLCKNKPVNYKDLDIVFLVSSGTTGSPKHDGRIPWYRLNPEGEKYIDRIGPERVADSKFIVKCSDIKLNVQHKAKDKDRKVEDFFEELKSKFGIFNLWDIKKGPVKFFSTKPECYLWFYRAYKIPVTINSKDYKPDPNDKYAPPVINDGHTEIKYLDRINSIDDMYSDPVLLDNDYDKRENEAFRLIAHHKLSDDPQIVESGLKSRHTLQENDMNEILYKKKQVILYGPPGTGKTYNTKKISIDFLHNK